MAEINWQVKHFNELTVPEYHDLLFLRIEVFVIEQDCPYQDVDNKDKVAYHVFGTNSKNETIAVARVLPQNISYPEISIGRICWSQLALPYQQTKLKIVRCQDNHNPFGTSKDLPWQA